MWKWTIKFDKAFEIPTYRVKANGIIVGNIRKFGTEWSWEVTFPGQVMPEDCRGTKPTRDECQEAIREKISGIDRLYDAEKSPSIDHRRNIRHVTGADILAHDRGMRPALPISQRWHAA